MVEVSQDRKFALAGLQDEQQEESILQLLAPLESLCLYRNEDWWTYEICTGRHVRQFHQQGTELLSEYLLGKYDVNASDVSPYAMHYRLLHLRIKPTVLCTYTCEMSASLVVPETCQ